MKIKTSMIDITRNYNKVYRVGYCEMQNIFRHIEPLYFNYGIYGWNCDIYVIGNIAITTGYRNMRGQKIPGTLVKKYDKKAIDIIEKSRFDYNKMCKELTKNAYNFLNELEKTIDK